MRIKGEAITLSVTLLLTFFIQLSGYSFQTNQAENFAVNFISTGGGVDHKAEKKFASFLKEFQDKNKLTLDYKIENWGKEGERKYIFDLSNTPKEEMKDFLKSVRKMFAGNKLVVVN